MEQKYRHNPRLKLMTLVILLLAVIAWVAWSFWPSSARQMKRSVAIVACRSWYEMACGGKTTLYFSGVAPDTALVRPSLLRDSCVRTTYATGVWVNRYFFIPSCRGRMITVMAMPDEINWQDAWKLIVKEKERNEKRIRQLRVQLRELNYYLRVHDVHDEGYNTVAACAYQKEDEKARCIRLARLFDTMRPADRPQLIRKAVYTAYYRLPDGECRQARMREVGSSKLCQTVLLQTVGERHPRAWLRCPSSLRMARRMAQHLPWATADLAWRSWPPPMLRAASSQQRFVTTGTICRRCWAVMGRRSSAHAVISSVSPKGTRSSLEANCAVY